MIQKIAACLILLFCCKANAQNTNLPVFPATSRLNYTRVWTATAPDPNPAALITRPLTDVKQVTQYYDGFGRPIQTIAKQASPQNSGTDMVNQFYYDPTTGKDIYKYLPFPSNVATAGDQTADGNFKPDGFQQQVKFYNTQLAGQTGETNVGPQSLNWAYQQTNYEASPANRVLNAYGPGVNWVGSQGSASPHNAQQQDLLNTTNDVVMIWSITGWSAAAPEAPSSIIPTLAGYYGSGQLHKTVTADEQGNQTIEFTDEYGQLILKKIQASNTPDPSYVGWLYTYYVYDDYGRLRFVITPDVVWQMVSTSSYVITQTQADELCYRYEYDVAGHMVVKKEPGTSSGALGEIWMIYDLRNRLVMQQDGNMRANKQWEYMQYDNLNRPVVKGMITDLNFYNNLAYNINNALATINWPVVSNYSASELMTQSYYDNYNSLPAPLSSSLDGSSNGTGNTSAFPPNTTNTAPYYAQLIISSQMTQGLVTATRTEVLGSNGSTYLPTVNFYDAMGRVIQSQSYNVWNGEDIATNQYTWSGQVLRSLLSHKGPGAQTDLVVTSLSFDQMGRPTQDIKIINSTLPGGSLGASSQIFNNTYNPLGQLSQKMLGNNIENQSLEYNVRGWLLGINRPYALNSASSSNYFGFELGYDQTAIAPSGGSSIGAFNLASFNGNLSGEAWKTRGDNQIRKYDYTYDQAGRMGQANFKQYNVSGNIFDNSAGLDFSVSIPLYDYNGNIQNMNQNGWVPGGSQPIDQLTYSYMSNNSSNRLMNIVDGSTYNVSNPQSMLGDLHYSGTKTAGASKDYGNYDNNANISYDLNRSISAITYNYLNQPLQITVTSKGNVQYQYDALGTKLSKTVTDNSVAGKTITTTTNYDGGIVYQTRLTSPSDPVNDYTNVLQYINHEEGRIRFVPATPTVPQAFSFDYFLRDQRGDVRMVLTDQSQTDPYPPATLETTTFQGGTAESVEKGYYTINTNDIVAEPSPMSSAPGGTYVNSNSGVSNLDPYSNATGNSAQVYKLNGSTGDNTGLGITLKVMAGDQVSIFGKSFWHNTGANPGSFPIAGALSTFITGFAGTTVNMGEQAVTGTALNGAAATTVPLNTFLTTTQNQSNPNAAPKAAINWILFNDQFVPQAASSSSDLVSNSGDVIKTHSRALPAVPVNGYLYVYCSNESDLDVYFDNLQVVNVRGKILEETHYYPCGLAMAAISDRAWNKRQNFFHYQGKEMQNQEFGDGTGLEEYDFHARDYDQQLGVWHNQDPAGQFSSPYTAMGDNWPNMTDPDGKYAVVDDLLAGAVGGLANLGKELISGKVHNFDQGLEYFGVGFAGGIAALYGGPDFSNILMAMGNSAVGGAKSVDIIWAGIDAGAAAGMSTMAGSLAPLAKNAGIMDKIINAAEKGAIKGLASTITGIFSSVNSTWNGSSMTDLTLGKALKAGISGAVLGDVDLLGTFSKTSQLERLGISVASSFGKSVSSNWTSGMDLLGKFNVAVGPATMTFGKKQQLFDPATNYQSFATLIQAGAKDILAEMGNQRLIESKINNPFSLFLVPEWIGGLKKTDNAYRVFYGWSMVCRNPDKRGWAQYGY